LRAQLNYIACASQIITNSSLQKGRKGGRKKGRKEGEGKGREEGQKERNEGREGRKWREG
jgi:hypothetical protein